MRSFNITLNSERPNAFPLRSGTRQGHLISPILFSVILASAIKWGERQPEWKGRSKALCIHRQPNCLY